MAQKISRYAQYIYFLRFSILLWLLVPVLARLDWVGATTSFTRGIFALESRQQAFWAAFFTIATYMVVLITARVVCVNGQERFAVDAPVSLQKLLGNQTTWALYGQVDYPRRAGDQGQSN